MSLQPCTLTQIGSPSLQRLQSENLELRQYLEAQRKVIASLERRVGRSLESLGVHVKALTTVSDAASEGQSSINSIQSEVDSLCDLLSDAMLLQKLEAGKVEPKLEPLLIEPLLNCVSRHLLEPRVQEPVRLICEFNPAMPKIWADQELTEAVLTDLLARGLRYSDPASVVVLGVAAVEDWVHYT
jgi:signal transduction histidine kinase